MTIQTKTLTQLVSDAVTAIQGGAALLVDMTVGSILRAFVEAISAVGMWLQGIALQIAALTRFASSNGPDADSWAADFGFTRLPAVAAEGPVTFARFTTTASATVPVGTVIQTEDGSQKYTVIADASQPTFSSGLNAYVMAIGLASCVATVVAQVAGAAGNAAAGMINTIGSSLPGVDTVTNAAGFTNGLDAELDPAFKARFVLFINSLDKATPGAIAYAVKSVQQGVSLTLTENTDYNGTPDLGYFYPVVDDGTGSPSSGLLNAIGSAVEAARPIGSRFGVFAPVVINADVIMTLTLDPAYLQATVLAIVTAALQSYINTLPIGGTLPFTRLAQVAYDATPAVLNVSAVSLNSAFVDLVATNQQVIKSRTVFLAVAA